MNLTKMRQRQQRLLLVLPWQGLQRTLSVLIPALILTSQKHHLIHWMMPRLIMIKAWRWMPTVSYVLPKTTVSMILKPGLMKTLIQTTLIPLTFRNLISVMRPIPVT